PKVYRKTITLLWKREQSFDNSVRENRVERMKKPPAQRAKLKRSFDKTPVQLTKEDAPRSREFDLRKRVNWWLGLILILPLVISFRAMDPIGPSRFVVLSI